jgi:PERQ amino acid-rich with GYF domain-containing protein
VEEFLQFLLQFPLDPPPSDLEIISDTVYSYSSTLDGRRFAAEFVSKRKADAANAKLQAKAGPGSTAGSGSKFSLADGKWQVVQLVNR